MIPLTTINDGIQIVLAAGTPAASLDCHVSYADAQGQTINLGNKNNPAVGGSGAGTYTIVLNPPAGFVRNVKYLSIYNNPGGLPNQSVTVNVQHTDGTTAVPIYQESILPGWSLVYQDPFGWTLYNTAGQAVNAPSGRPSVVFNGLECFGHSYLDNPFLGAATNTSAITTLNSNFLFQDVFASLIGLGREMVRNHGVAGAQFLAPGCSQGGFARVLNEIGKQGRTNYPFCRAGGAYLFCWGANDVGNTASGSQALLRSTWQNAMVACISKARASAIYLAATSGQWTFGTNFSTSAAASQDFTSGNGTSKQATVVDSSGTSTATFTIPYGYKGEPICFNMVALSGGSLIVTWGGNLTGTTSIVGRTDTLSSASTQATTAYGVRFTGPVNGLSAANAGQTITVRITTVSGSTFTLDGCWIESFKPPPVLWVNFPRLPERVVTYALGDGVTTGVNTSFTSASANFLTATDAGQPITETDAQGAFTAGKTISSVTNATTIVLSGNAAAAHTSIQYTFGRLLAGYSNGQYGFSNTDFTGATAASHAAADADVTNLNATMRTVAALFNADGGQMVQIVDIDAAMGSDATVPSNVYSWFALDGNHPNDLGVALMARTCWYWATQLQPSQDSQDFSGVEMSSSPINYIAPSRRIVRSGQRYTAEGCGPLPVANTYTCVLGDVFAIPIRSCDSTQIWTQAFAELISATGAATLRIAVYDDVNEQGYPQFLRKDGGTISTGTTATTFLNFTAWTPQIHQGLYWLALKVDVAGTAALLRTMTGPCQHMPSTLATAGSLLLPCAWKVSGVAAGTFPNTFPTGGVLSGSTGTTPSATVSPCPYFGTIITTSPP